MSQKSKDDQSIRAYLLGQLPQAEEDAIDDRLLGDQDYFEQFELVEDELIDEYACGSLSDSEQERFVARFLVVPERIQKVRFALAMHKYASNHPIAEATVDNNRFSNTNTPESSVKRRSSKSVDTDPEPDHKPRNAKGGGPKPEKGSVKFASSPYFKIAASILLLIGLGAVTYRFFFYQSDIDRAVALEREMYKSERPLESRISNLDYAPMSGGSRGPTDTLSSDYEVNHELARSYLTEALLKEPNAKSEHAMGEFYLMDKEFDQAIVHLQNAVNQDASKAEFHNDLGVAFLENGKKLHASSDTDSLAKGQESLQAALAEFNKALDIDQSFLAALFNRALCYTAMGDKAKARADWELYIRNDPNSNWVDDARTSLKLLDPESH
ncbi:MAG: tetratricopeptide repeat protein [Blastocatellia bacterium]